MKRLNQETKPMRYLRLYRWLKDNGYSVKVARASARLQAGYLAKLDKYWHYWKMR